MPEKKTQIAPGSRVRMHFSLTLPDDTEVVSTYRENPLEFTLGDNTMEQMLELSLLGLQAGDEQSLLISGDDVYGTKDDERVHWVNKKEFPADQALNTGQVIAFTTPTGEALAGVIEKIERERVLVDFNHPLSGKTIRFKVTILRVEQP
ncbi:MAG: FKBP-type peptidyl-prolyl cis-trans isomerase [Candidatus Thiodiazotropha sp. (ex Dulcina madagascariensis)]|nr:FKBP-type peptidyl-prolyl cis-trans isomerase [Candidatus Thiodiazotropha sp. (ex Dulcina madagascariensis)]MCU7926034.1 FKBP-type peptidyl-prolyl cis-trans isomerase [Candidatus Thiodiazotropha sp. (ex Dulcina madagascariensis)]